MIEAAQKVAKAARRNADEIDRSNTFPASDVAALAAAGLLTAPLPLALGGHALGLYRSTAALTAQILATIGSGSLPLGRLYEGHVNAVKLIHTFGRPEQITNFARLAREGHLFAVWNSEGRDGVELISGPDGNVLRGRKLFASGAGHVSYPLITARCSDGRSLMVVPTIDDQRRVDLSTWDAHGMRPSFSGAVDFTGLPIEDAQIIGGPDDFHAQPCLSAGAWRFAAVQTGGIAAVFDAARTHLKAIGRQDDPHQRARMGESAAAVQTARLWVVKAGQMADDEDIDADARIAFVNLARTVVERTGLDVLELSQRSVGLAGFQKSHPLERLARDLATYLRQPNPDKALVDGGAFSLSVEMPILDLWPWS